MEFCCSITHTPLSHHVAVPFPAAGASDVSVANSSLIPASLEAQLPTSSDPLSTGATSVTSSLTQPMVAEKLMWSPSTPTATRTDSTAAGTCVDLSLSLHVSYLQLEPRPPFLV